MVNKFVAPETSKALMLRAFVFAAVRAFSFLAAFYSVREEWILPNLAQYSTAFAFGCHVVLLMADEETSPLYSLFRRSTTETFGVA